MTKFLPLLGLLFCRFCIAIDVTFLNPATPTHAFWNEVTKITQFAADDFGINLTIVYGQDNRMDNMAKLMDIVQAKKKPDYLVFMPYTGNAFQSFQLLDKANIKFFTLERSIPQTERERLGDPGVQFKHWIGEIYHDNVAAGENLTKALVEAAKATYAPQASPFITFGITGDYSGESYDRSKGLVNLITATNQCDLKQVIHANWSPEQAIEKYDLLVKRYGDAQIVWSASDTMALAIADHTSKTRTGNTHNLVIGGFDWLPEAIKAIEKDQLTASVGGHVFMGAWSMIKVYDHNHNSKNAMPHMSTRYELSVITKNNLDFYRPIFDENFLKQIDFKRMSLTANKAAKNYNFNAQAIIRSVSK